MGIITNDTLARKIKIKEEFIKSNFLLLIKFLVLLWVITILVIDTTTYINVNAPNITKFCSDNNNNNNSDVKSYHLISPTTIQILNLTQTTICFLILFKLTAKIYIHIINIITNNINYKEDIDQYTHTQKKHLINVTHDNTLNNKFWKNKATLYNGSTKNNSTTGRIENDNNMNRDIACNDIDNNNNNNDNTKETYININNSISDYKKNLDDNNIIDDNNDGEKNIKRAKKKNDIQTNAYNLIVKVRNFIIHLLYDTNITLKEDISAVITSPVTNINWYTKYYHPTLYFKLILLCILYITYIFAYEYTLNNILISNLCVTPIDILFTNLKYFIYPDMRISSLISLLFTYTYIYLYFYWYSLETNDQNFYTNNFLFVDSIFYCCWPVFTTFDNKGIIMFVQLLLYMLLIHCTKSWNNIKKQTNMCDNVNNIFN